ncbi:MAG: hypothetical protein AB1641_28630 [Thermodesulfobacteriota bacterium]
MTPVQCSRCRTPLPPALFNIGETGRCPRCGSRLNVTVFPALFQEKKEKKVEDGFLFEDGAACFYHPRKKAVVPCSSCGRFLCSLCDVEFDGRHLCPACLETGKKKHKFKNLEDRRILYDRMALYLAVGPILFWPVTILTAPAAIYVSLRYWKAPTSLTPRTKIRFLAAQLIAALQLSGWGLYLYYVLL